MGHYEKINFNIVLVEPEIPQNTGNIGRTCVGMHSKLHLVKPLGFDLSEKQLRRAGLDYWQYLEWQVHESLGEWLRSVPDPSRVFFFTTKVEKPYFDRQFQEGDWLVFGKETKGLDAELLKKHSEQCVTIPFVGEVRSFNLSNSVAMALGEGMRQLKHSGQL